MKRAFFLILIFLIVIFSVWAMVCKFESAKPVVDIQLPSLYLNKNYEMTVDISDDKTGLRQAMISIMQQGKEKVLLDKSYEPPGIINMFYGDKVVSDSFVIPVQSWKYGMTDGDAVIRIRVTDRSWRGLNTGNIFYVEKNVIIDSKPPRVKVLSQRHNIERGGAGLVIYQIFEDNIKSGIQVGDHFFPGHSGLFKDLTIHTAFFALKHTQGPGTQIHVKAEDPAGNITQRGFHTYIRDKKFKTDVIRVSSGFLEKKIPDFDVGPMEGEFSAGKNPLLDKYVFINREIRKQNVDKVLGVPAATEAKKYWEGRFLRLAGSQRRAGFADHRIYKINGKEVDREVHLGIDLASTSSAPVKAANGGRIIFTGSVGIFGNTIIIDHGFGLCSLYAHLSAIEVQEQQVVKKGMVIGNSGETGLAGGDHLHFSMIVHDVFVNPVEWWDSAWIKNNITSKIEAVKQMSHL